MKTIKVSNDPVIKDLYNDLGDITVGFESGLLRPFPGGVLCADRS